MCWAKREEPGFSDHPLAEGGEWFTSVRDETGCRYIGSIGSTECCSVLTMWCAIRILRDRKRTKRKQLVSTDPKEAKTQGKPQCYNYTKGFLPGFHSNHRIRWSFHKWAKLRSLWCTSYKKYKAKAGQNPSLKYHWDKNKLGTKLSLLLQWKREGRRWEKWGVVERWGQGKGPSYSEMEHCCGQTLIWNSQGL